MSEQTKLCGTVYKVAVDITKVDLEKKEVVIDEYETVKSQENSNCYWDNPQFDGCFRRKRTQR